MSSLVKKHMFHLQIILYKTLKRVTEMNRHQSIGTILGFFLHSSHNTASTTSIKTFNRDILYVPYGASRQTRQDYDRVNTKREDQPESAHTS